MEKEEKENTTNENEATKRKPPTTSDKLSSITTASATPTPMAAMHTSTINPTSSSASAAPTANSKKDNHSDNSNTASTKHSPQQLAAAAEKVAVTLAVAKELPSQAALNDIIRAHLEQRSPVQPLAPNPHALSESVTANGHVEANKSATNKSEILKENDGKKLEDDSGRDRKKPVEQNVVGGIVGNSGIGGNNNADVAEQGNEPTPTASIRSIGSFVCRICHNAENPERLVSPCLCKGSLTYVHIHCLERWISTSRNTTCELCQFQYNTEQTLRYTCLQSLRMWYSRSMSRRALQEDCQMFSLLTLVAFGIIGTLLVGIQYYYLQGRSWGLGRLWTKGWLVFFLFTTVVVYFINIYMIVRSQLAPWYRWWQSARDIKLILENRKPFQFLPSRRLQNRQMTETTSSSAMTVYPAPPPSPATAHPEQQQQPSCAFANAAAQLPPDGTAPQTPQYPLHLQLNRNAVVAAALAEFDDYGNRCNNIPYNYYSSNLNNNANNSIYNNSSNIYNTGNSILCNTGNSNNSSSIYHNNNIYMNNSNGNHTNNAKISSSNNKYVVAAGLPLAVLGNPVELADAAATAAVSGVATAVEIPLEAVIYETAL